MDRGDDVDSLSSSSSDDEYLAMNQSDQHRESLVRKKLLENFYGKSAVAAAAPDENDEAAAAGDNDEDDELLADTSFLTPRQRGGRGSNSRDTAASAEQKDNLDSPAFDAQAHTQRHVLHSNVNALLQTEESLALQVRTLDSTMQTLVYENYSRFIDATNAIRNIGVNVQANDAGLRKLTTITERVDHNSKTTEESLGALRDQVAEKIRVKRLLSRLDSLLKLPETLNLQIAQGKYRMATKSYLNARSILGKHSHGFESLKTIETECTGILKNVKSLLARKLQHWNGRFLENIHEDMAVLDNDEDLQEPPKAIHEIFECVGTLHILMEDSAVGFSQQDGEEEKDADPVQSLNVDELHTLALGAATRALDRILDAHIIRVQEDRFSLAVPSDDNHSSSHAGIDSSVRGVDGTEAAPLEPGAILVPREFLDAILEVATLYGMTFSKEGRELLNEFISESFSTFLSHVRSVFLEESSRMTKGYDLSGVLGNIEESDVALNPQRDMLQEDEDAVDAKEEEISQALTLLLRDVHEMSSGLALPEVGVEPEVCQQIVGEALTVVDYMVTRRVHQKLYDLRISVIKTCLVPYAERLVEQRNIVSEKGGGEDDELVFARQLASSTLSDCLQLVDDMVRSIAVTGVGGGGPAKTSGSNNQPQLLKVAVQEGLVRFAEWLAGALEVLAGGEGSSNKSVVEVAPPRTDEEENADPNANSSSTTPQSSELIGDDLGDMDIVKLVDSARLALAKSSDFNVAIAELCRLAQGSFTENLEQSLSTHLGTGKRKSRHLFGASSDDGPRTSMSSHGQEDGSDEISQRFGLAACRILAFYAQKFGSEASSLLVSSLGDLPLDEDKVDAAALHDCACLALEKAKALALESARIFGGPDCAGPVPEMDSQLGALGRGGLSGGGLSGARSGLIVDVELIFKEKIVVYLHPSQPLDFSRNAMLFLMLKVALRGWLEGIRLSAFPAAGYKKMQVNVELLKLMIGHYIDEDYQVNGNNAVVSLTDFLSDIMRVVGERCLDDSCETDDFMLQDSRAIVQDFITAEVADDGSRFIIVDKDA